MVSIPSCESSAHPPPPERPARARWLIFVLACAVSWLLYLHRYSWSIVKTQLKKENPDLTATDLGWLDSAFQGAYAIGQVPSGLAGDLLGARAVLPLMIVLWSLASVGVIWLTSGWALAAVRAALGLSQAGAYPVLNKMTRNWFPLAGRTSVQGTIAAMGRIGAACSPLILAWLLMGKLHLPWRSALLILAAPGLVLGAAFWLLVRNRPRDHPWSNDAEQKLVEAGEPAPLPAGQRKALLRDGATLFAVTMLLAYSFASTFQDQLYVYWIPLYLTDGHKLSEENMGWLAPWPLLGGAFGSVLGGWLNDALIRAGWPRRWVRSGVALTGKTVAAGLVLLSVFAGDAVTAMLLLAAARSFGDWSLATQWGAITDMAGRGAGTVFGLVNTAGALGGFLAGPVLGQLKDRYGWEGLFLGVAALCLVSALTWLFIDCTRRVVPD
jgi:sugar phosphate permease